jgi:hypothetical protein
VGIDANVTETPFARRSEKKNGAGIPTVEGIFTWFY